MNDSQALKPVILNLDKHPSQLAPNESYYIQNQEISLGINAKSVGSIGKSTPYPTNFVACDMELPAGENYSVGARYEPLTNESYSWVFNSNGVHFISRVNGDGTCQIVYHGCLDLSADPKRYIADWRANVTLEKVCPNRDGRYLRWVDGDEEASPWFIDVEASIATDFFTTPFFKTCKPDPCDFVRLCVPEIVGCIQAQFIPLPANEVGLSNNLLDRSFKFMIKHVYYDGRESEWSSWSIPYYQQAATCFNSTSNLSRCLKLRIPLGNPMVDKIKVAFSEDGGLTWFVCETVDKYKKYNDLQEKWYQRQLAEFEGYSETDCSFDYIFCNNKERVQVPSTELTRVRNPIARGAQGSIQIGEAIGYYNYKDGVCPVDKKELDKITLTLDCGDPNVQQDCNPEFVEVTVRAVIHSFPGSANRYIFRYLGGTITADDDPTEIAYYGGTGYPFQTNMSTKFGQNFEGKVRGFLPYVEGYDYFAETKQWYAGAFFNSPKEIGIVANQGSNDSLDYVNIQIRNGNFYYSEAKIKVLKGTRGFIRIPNQSMIDGVGVSQNTSTSVVAILDDIHNYTGINMPQSHFDFTRKEIYFDTCNGDVVLNEVFVIKDLADQEDIFHSNETNSYVGYIKDNRGNPVEGLVLKFTYTSGDNAGITINLGTTDHNGYYAFTASDVDVVPLDIYAELSCASFTIIKSISLFGADGTVSVHDIVLDDDSYATNYYLQVQQRVIDCNGNPVAGVKVAVGGSKAKVTDAEGIAHLILRNYSTRNRIIHTVVVNAGGCFTLDCDNNCNPCMPNVIAQSIPCYFGTPIFAMTDMKVNINSLLSLENGLKAGGRYPFAAQLEGNCGRVSSAYQLKYFDIPRTQDKNGLGFCGFKFDLGSFVGPTWANNLKLLRGGNENDYQLQWVVDKKEYIGDGKIKLTIQSLNDYNQKYFFQSNTIYQWLKGDRVEFIRNGNGKVLTTADHGLLNYLTISPFHDVLISGQPNADADYFNQLIIEDDKRLDDVTDGAIIEIQRPKTSTGETIYYDICVNIPLTNGVPSVLRGTFSSFDTYIVSRTSGSFLGYFESKYPSDFWGKTTDGVGLDDTGKRYVYNPYETEKRYGQNITLASPTVYNRFGDIIKTICPKSHGDITAMYIWDGRVILGIAEHDNFLAQSANDLLRLRTDGTVGAQAADAVISDAEPKVRGQFGCQYDSIGSVLFGDGYAMWVDENRNALVRHDFNEAKDVSEGRIQSYFRIRCQEKKLNNHQADDYLNYSRWICGINRNSGVMFLTFKKLRNNGISNAVRPYQFDHDTITFHPTVGESFGFISFTPDSYSQVNLHDENGCSFISNLNGVPYIHPVLANSYNEFFGITVDRFVGVTLNKFPEKIKTALALEIQDVVMWFVAEVTTENTNFISEIPPIKMKRTFDKWNGAFLADANSREGLFAGKPASGYFIKATLVRDNTDGLIYNSINPDKRRAYDELDTVFIKFKVSEESGYTNNQ